MKTYRFWLKLSQAEYLSYYQGQAKAVLVKDIKGETIQFPANLLRQHVTHSGIYGFFELLCDAENRFISLKKVSVS